MSINKATLCGHVGNQPEIKTLDNGKKVARFSLATTEKYTDKNNQPVETTEWHNIISWRHAEIIEKYVAKGDKIYIEGKISTRKWEKDNQPRSITEIEVSALEIFFQKKERPREEADSYSAAPKQAQQAVFTASGQEEDDLPF